MSVLNRKLGREFRNLRLRLAAIVGIMALGAMCFVYMRSSYNNLRIAQSRYYATNRLADFWVDFKKAPLPEIEAVARISGVSQIRSRIQHFVTVDLDGVARPLNGLTISLPDDRESIVNDVLIRRGEYFTPTRRKEVIVNDAFAREHKLKPGDKLRLLLNGSLEELVIVGAAISAEFVYLVGPGAIAPDPKNFGVFYLKRSYAEEVFDMEGAANQVVGMLAPAARERPQPVLDAAKRELAAYGVAEATPRRDQASNRFLSDEIRGLGVFSTIMPAIFLTVAVTILNVLLRRLVTQQRTVVGTLKAIGYGDRQIFGHYLKFGLAIGAMSGTLGCVLGYGMSEWVTSIYRQFYEFPVLNNRVYPGVYCIAGGICVICGGLGSLRGCAAALRLQPAEAMRAAAPARGAAIWLERFAAFWRRISFGWRMTLRNIVRQRARTLVGVFSGSMGAALLVTGLMSAAGTDYLIDFQFTRIVKSDMDLQFRDEHGMDALLEARRLPGVDYAEPRLDVPCDIVHGPRQRKSSVSGLIDDARLTVPRDVAGRALQIPRSGLLMSRKLAQLLQVSPGDRVTVIPVKGRREPIEMPITQITDSYLGMSVYADLHYLSDALGAEPLVNGVQLSLRSDAKQRKDFYREVKRLPALQATSARQDAIDNLTETVVKIQRFFIGLLIFFAGAIFFGSVLNAALIALAERQREVATFFVLGFTPRQIGGLFLRESLLVNLAGILLGLPLGLLLMFWLTVAYDTEMFRFPFVAPPSVWITTIVTGAVFGLAAHLVVQREINRMDFLDALKTKE